MNPIKFWFAIVSALVGIGIGLVVGTYLGLYIDRSYVDYWRSMTFTCVEALEECETKLEYCPQRRTLL